MASTNQLRAPKMHQYYNFQIDNFQENISHEFSYFSRCIDEPFLLLVIR